MILSISDIKDILDNKPNRADVEAAQKMRNELFAHIFGIGLDRLLLQINSFENKDQYEARKKYARSNKDIMERVARPIDKIFSATGGSTYYDLPESKDKEFRNRLRNTENGLSLRKWVEQYWKPAYLADPMGLIFIEVDQSGDAYPTYKGSNDIVDYKLNGRNLDYVVFRVDKKGEDNTVEIGSYSVKAKSKYYRVVDDANDYMVKYDGQDVTIITSESYPNYFGAVPAIINSDRPIIGTDYFESPFQVVMDLANEYLRECSVKSVYKLLHGFPKYWEYQSVCPECKGTKFTEGKPCPVCKGTGMRLKADVTDARLIPVPAESGDVKIAPDVAGYVVPPVEAWSKMSEEIDDLFDKIYETIWGTKQVEEGDNDTATGRFINTQPVNDRLSKFSEAAESVEKFITDIMGAFYYGSSYKGSSVSYGRRYQIESPDAIWEKYQGARSKGAPESMLDDLLKEYLQSKYENNSLELQKRLRMLDLEPFPHQSAQQIQSLNIDPVDYVKKIYFTDFIKTLNENEIIFSPINTLQEKFNTYIKDKNHEETGSNRPDQDRTGERN